MRVRDTQSNQFAFKQNKSSEFREQYSIKVSAQSPKDFIKRSSTSVSFKGVSSLFYFTKDVKIDNFDALYKIAKRDLGSACSSLLKNIKNSENPESFLKFVKDSSSGTKSALFKEKTLTSSVFEYLTFPVTKLPFLVADSALKYLEKFTSTAELAGKLRSNGPIKAARVQEDLYSDTSKLRGILTSIGESIKTEGLSIEQVLEMEKNPQSVTKVLFNKANGYFDPKTGNYSTVHERSFNRLVTGLIPAWFLGNDAYNLSVMCGDKTQTSKEEKDRRIKQEVVRIFTNSYITLVSLGSFEKIVNRNPTVSAAITALTVLISETLSRKLSGTPILFLDSKTAKTVNSRKGQDNQVKPILSSDSKKILGQPGQVFKASFSDSMILPNNAQHAFEKNIKVKKSDQNSKENKKTLFSFQTLKKGIAFLLGGGFALAALRNSTMLNGLIKRLAPSYKLKDAKNTIIKDFMDYNWGSMKNKVYDLNVTKPFQIDSEEYSKVISALRNQGFNFLADGYEDIASAPNKDGKILLNSVNKYAKSQADKIVPERVNTKYKPLVDLLIQPFKFVFAALKLPFNMARNVLTIPAVVINHREKSIGKDGLNIIEKFIKKASSELFGPVLDKASDKPNKQFIDGITKISEKIHDLESGKIDDVQFKDFLNKAVVYKHSPYTSSYKNTSLANLTKIVSSTITSFFLVADNYNMVMLKTNGEDKTEAESKAKDRVVQRVSGMFYQTMFMDLFNSTFQRQYHSGLMGMATVSGVNTIATEIFTRKSIGMPVGPKSYDELLKKDEDNRGKKGLIGAYYRFMSALTGKKPLERRDLSVLTPSLESESYNQLVFRDKKDAATNLVNKYCSN